MKTNNFIDKKKIICTLKPLSIPFFKVLDAKSQFTAKDPDAGKDEGKRRRGQQRMRWLDRWHHQLNGHEFEKTPGDSEGQGSLAHYSPWGHRVRYDIATEQHQGKKARMILVVIE